MSRLKLWFLGFRKTIVTLVFLFVTTVLLVAGQLPPDNWLENLRYVLIAYLGANACEHGLTTMRMYYDTKGSQGKGPKAPTSSCKETPRTV